MSSHSWALIRMWRLLLFLRDPWGRRRPMSAVRVDYCPLCAGSSFVWLKDSQITPNRYTRLPLSVRYASTISGRRRFSGRNKSFQIKRDCKSWAPLAIELTSLNRRLLFTGQAVGTYKIFFLILIKKLFGKSHCSNITFITKYHKIYIDHLHIFNKIMQRWAIIIVIRITKRRLLCISINWLNDD